MIGKLDLPMALMPRLCSLAVDVIVYELSGHGTYIMKNNCVISLSSNPRGRGPPSHPWASRWYPGVRCSDQFNSRPQWWPGVGPCAHLPLDITVCTKCMYFCYKSIVRPWQSHSISQQLWHRLINTLTSTKMLYKYCKYLIWFCE